MIRISPGIAVLLGWVLLLSAGEVNAQARGSAARNLNEKVLKVETLPVSVDRDKKLADIDAWLRRLVGHFRVKGNAMQVINDGSRAARGVDGVADCAGIGAGSGVSCVIDASWMPILYLPLGGGAGGLALSEAYNTLQPAIMLFSLDPDELKVNFTLVDDHGIASSWSGLLLEDTVAFVEIATTNCWGSPALPHCARDVRITASARENELVKMQITWPSTAGTFIELLLHRKPDVSVDAVPKELVTLQRDANTVPGADVTDELSAVLPPESSTATTQQADLPESNAANQVPPTERQEDGLLLLRMLAIGGDRDAQFQLGSLHSRGEGVPQDGEQALLWWRRAAEQGLADAQNELGVALGSGVDVPPDPKQAVDWYRKAAAQGLAVAQANLGTMYMNGTGVRRDPRQAVEWYRKAADQGLGWAQFYLGDAYYLGAGVRANYLQAFDWYRRAAEQEYTDAEYAVGVMYQRGAGVAGDNSLAAYWLLRALQHGHENAGKSLDQLVGQLRRVRRHAAFELRERPDASAPVMKMAEERASVYELKRVQDWVQVYIKEDHLVGYVPAEQLRGK